MDPATAAAAGAVAGNPSVKKWLVGTALAAFFLLCVMMIGAGGAVETRHGVPGQFQDGAGAALGLDAEQMANAEISLGVADELEVTPHARLSMVVSALGESMFRVVPNGAGSGYCGVFQAHPDNIPCDDTYEQARRFFIGGKGFQAGGAIYLAKTYPDMSPGTIATKVEASGEPGSFYDAHRPQAEQIIAAWEEGEGSFPVSSETEEASARQVLRNPNVGLNPGQRADIESGGIDGRTLTLLNWMGERHKVLITALRKDHDPGSNHEAGRAIDIGAVDQFICRGGRVDPCATLVRELARMGPPLRSTELIYCWDPDPADPNMFARSDHCDHIHAGWDAGAPAGAKP